MVSQAVLRREVPVYLEGAAWKQEDAITRSPATIKVMRCAGDDELVASWLPRGLEFVARLVDPPLLSSLYLRQTTMCLPGQPHINRIFVESATANLIVMELFVLTSGRPDVYHAVYDSSNNSLTMVPHVRCSYKLPTSAFRAAAVIVPCGGQDSFFLANLGFESGFESLSWGKAPPFACLYLWSPASGWKRIAASFNREMPPPQPILGRGLYKSFNTDVSFLFQGQAFWVDLVGGVIVCDVLSPCVSDYAVQLCFIHLPKDCPWFDFQKGDPTTHRTMGRVRDSVKFISLGMIHIDDFSETEPSEIVVRSWTLSSDLQEWKRDDDMTLPLPQLWESEAFRKKRLPRCKPSHPILSIDEDGIVYFLLSEFTRSHGRVIYKGDYVICVDMCSKTLLAAGHYPQGSPVSPALVGAECACHTEA